jgi:glucokinase
MNSEMNAIGIDLGGTNVKAVLITQQGEIIARSIVPIRDSDWRGAVHEAFTKVKAKSPSVSCIGLAAPGLPDHNNKQINYMPGRLEGLGGFNWSDFLQHEVHVLNDAHAALLAEVNFGVAKGFKNVVMLTLGTGVGGAILINGLLYQGVNQRAGSIGDMSLNAESKEIGFLQVPGTLEDSMGNESVPKRSGNKFQTTRDLVEAYSKGDVYATEVWLLSVKKLAVALCSLINILAPEQIVLGGGIAQSDERLFTPLSEFMNEYEWRPDGNATPVVKALFNDFAGAIGAACFALDRRNK